MSKASPTRRRFLCHTATVAGCLALGSRRALASPNEQINIGIVGMGWRGGQLAEAFGRLPGVNVHAICDVDTDRLNEAGEKYGVAERHVKYETLLANPTIDAVLITTPNHWHCLLGIRACEAGKHVYVEKPLGHDLWQQRQLIAAARRHNRVAQIGTQQRSDPMQAEIKRFLHEERGLGELTSVVAARYGARQSIGKRDQPLTPPKSVDYDRWLGPSREEPIFRDQLHYDWHWDWNTGDGEMGNWGVHLLDDVRNVALRDAHALPSAVTSLGGRVVWNDAGKTPNVHLTLFETPTIPVVCAISNLEPVGGKQGQLREAGVETGYVVYAEGGRYEGWRGGGAAYDTEGKKIQAFRGNSGEPTHYSNFIDAVRRGSPETLNADIQVGHESTAWCLLANSAVRLGSQADHAALVSAGADPTWRSVLDTMDADLKKRGLDLNSPSFVHSDRLAVDPVSESLGGSPAGPPEYRQGYTIPRMVG